MSKNATEKHEANNGVLTNAVPVARVTKSYSTTGEVAVRLIGRLENERPVFIYFDGLPVPFFIDSVTRKGNSGAIIKFSTVNSYKESLTLVGKELFVSTLGMDEALLSEYFSDREKILSNIAGAVLLNARGENVGIITEFFDYPENPCIGVSLAPGLRFALSEGGDSSFAEIPFNAGLILEANLPESIKMEIPDGLVIS